MKKTLRELAKQIQKDNLETLGKINEKKIVKIIKEAFSQVKNEIENTENESVKIQMLGNFKIRTVEREKEGEMTTIRRIVFRPSKAKE